MPRDLFTEIEIPKASRGEPAWALATLFPAQGAWSEDDFFQMEAEHFIELVDGCIEVLPMPTWLHQRIVLWLARQMGDWSTTHRLGEVLIAPLPLKLFPGTIREPDILLAERTASGAVPARYPSTALLVCEVVSEGGEARTRDLVDKRRDYARAGIAEYWIVDPAEKIITVLVLDGTEYREHGRFAAGQTATSLIMEEFAVETDAVWALETNF